MSTVTVADVRQRSNVTYRRESHLETISGSHSLMNESGCWMQYRVCSSGEKILKKTIFVKYVYLLCYFIYIFSNKMPSLISARE